jgi:hypothetical protein
MALSPAQVEQFHEQGFLIFENVLEPDELEAMRRRAELIASGALPEDSGIKRQVEPGVARGEMDAATFELSLRKMTGLALAHDSVFEAHARRARLVEIIASLLGPELTLYQDQLF